MSKGMVPPRASALVHGAAWRAASLAARVGFLAVVVPRTLPGEFGVFFSYSSIGLLMARALSFGAIDHLPTRIRGNVEAMRSACVDISPLFALACAITVSAMLIPSLIASTLAVALSMASGLMLAGAVRSVSPVWFERWMNLHPILLLATALLLGDGVRANELMVLQAASLLASQPLLLRFAVVSASSTILTSRAPWRGRMGALLAGGSPRMLSDVLIAACIRSIAVGPVLFGFGAISDSLALALAVGEAVWMVGMILVHRNFSFYCSSGPDRRHSVQSAGLLLGGISVAGLAAGLLVFEFAGLQLLQRVEPDILFASFVFFAGVTSLSELRYFDVAGGQPLLPWIAAQLSFVAFATVISGVADERTAIWCIAMVTVGAALVIVCRRLCVWSCGLDRRE